MGDLFLPVLTGLFCDLALSPLQDINEVILDQIAVREHEGYEGSFVTKGLCQQHKTFRACLQRVCQIREFKDKNTHFHVSTAICAPKNFEMGMMFTGRGTLGFLRRRLNTF